MKKVYFIILLIAVASCNNSDNITTKYYSNGNPKETIYKNNSQIDSVVYYYENVELAVKTINYWKNNAVYYQKDFFEDSKIMREGKLLRDNFRIGKWNLYSPENYKCEVIEYLDIRNQQYVNQSWKLNNKGDTLSGGNYFNLIRKKDTIYFNQPNRFHFFLNQKTLNDSEVFICIPSPNSYVESNFSNEFSIKWDTINNMSREFSNHPIYKDWKYDVLFEIMPTKVKNDTLKGFLLEMETIKDNDTIDFITRKIYFDIPYYVKE